MKYLQRGFNIILPKLEKNEYEKIKMKTLIPMRIKKEGERICYKIDEREISKFLLHKNREKNNYGEIVLWNKWISYYDISNININKLIEGEKELNELIENDDNKEIYNIINEIKEKQDIDMIRKIICITSKDINVINERMISEGRSKDVKNLIGKDLNFKMKYLYGKELIELISNELKEESGKYEEKYLELVKRRNEFINNEVMEYVTKRIEKMNKTNLFFNWKESNGKFELFRPGNNADKFYEYEIIK
jgi:hypothetical protein